MTVIKLGSVMRFLIRSPPHIPPFNFSSLKRANVLQMYLKQSPSLSKGLTNCLHNLSLICKGEKENFSRDMRGAAVTISSPTFNAILKTFETEHDCSKDKESKGILIIHIITVED